MTTLKLTDAAPAVISFDGSILEVFHNGSNFRFHVSLLDQLRVDTDKKGKHMLQVISAGGYGTTQGIPVDEAALPKVNVLIEELQKAKARFKFD